MSTVLDPVDVSAPEDLDPLVHWTMPPYTHGVCGTLLMGVDRPDAEISCVVCIDLLGPD